MATTVYLQIEGKRGGAYPLVIRTVEAENMFSWLVERVEDSRMPGMFSSKIEYFRSPDGSTVQWTDIIASQLAQNSKENPITVIIKEYPPVAQLIPLAVQEYIAVLASAVRSRADSSAPTGQDKTRCSQKFPNTIG